MFHLHIFNFLFKTRKPCINNYLIKNFTEKHTKQRGKKTNIYSIHHSIIILTIILFKTVQVFNPLLKYCIHFISRYLSSNEKEFFIYVSYEL